MHLRGRHTILFLTVNKIAAAYKFNMRQPFLLLASWLRLSMSPKRRTHSCWLIVLRFQVAREEDCFSLHVDPLSWCWQFYFHCYDFTINLSMKIIILRNYLNPFIFCSFCQCWPTWLAIWNKSMLFTFVPMSRRESLIVCNMCTLPSPSIWNSNRILSSRPLATFTPIFSVILRSTAFSLPRETVS